MSGSGPGFVPSGNGFIIEYAGAQGGEKRFNDIITDSSGNIYVAGMTEGSGDSHALVAKFNSSGVIQNQKDYDTYNGDFEFETIQRDSSGNIYLFGQRRVAAYGSTAFQVTKLNSSFVVQDQKDLTRTSGARAANVSGGNRASNGDLYVFGAQGNDFFAAKLNSSYSLTFAKEYDTGNTDGNPVSLGLSSGDAIIAFYDLVYSGGVFTWSSNFAKLSSAGGVDFETTLAENTSPEYIYDLAVDSSNNIYGVGMTRTQSSTPDAWLFKTNSGGSVQWERYIGGSGDEYFRSVTTDSSGNVYAVGETNTGFSSLQLLIVKYNSSGTLQWQRTFSYSGGISQYESAITHHSGKIYVTATRGSGTNTALVLVLPDDGSETGNFYGYSYASSSLSNGTDSHTETSLSLSVSTPSPAMTVYTTSSTERTLTHTSQVKEI